MINMRERRALQLMKDLFNTKDGQEVLAYLKDSYVDNTALQDTVERTYYKLGQKEFVQSLIRSIKDESILDEIIIRNNAQLD